MVAKRPSPSTTCKNFLLSYSSMQAKYQFSFSFSTLDTKVLVINGYAGYDKRLADTEVLDLINPDLKCQNLAPFAKGKWGATGALVNTSAVVCGGYDGDYSNECHTISKSNITFLTHLDTKRSGAASIAVNNTLWVLGGYYGGSLSSTEYVGIPSEDYWKCKNGTNITITKLCDGKKDCSEGEDEEHCMMPLPLYGHTILEIEPNVYLLIGGGYSSYDGCSEKTYIKRDYQNWTPGPNLTTPRMYHTAGLVTDQINQRKSVVVFGGLTNGYQLLNSVEMLSLPIEGNMWQPGN